ncbi:MAG: hypothetical protein ABI361_10325 [Nitrososphaera sp.]
MPRTSQVRSAEKTVLVCELESLGFSSILLNDLNDIAELKGLVELIKQSFLQEYRKHWGFAKLDGRGAPGGKESRITQAWQAGGLAH